MLLKSRWGVNKKAFSAPLFLHQNLTAAVPPTKKSKAGVCLNGGIGPGGLLSRYLYY